MPSPEPAPLFPEISPFAQHHLAVDNGHVLYIEECGRRDGLPVVFLHGGPGSGCTPAQRRLFDPKRFRAILLDQRGSGRSTPLGSRRANTTAFLVADLERIRQFLGIDRWLVFGGSWGSLLGLAYAQAYPERVRGLLLRGIFLGSPEELQAYVQGVGNPVPDAWQRFAEAMPVDERRKLMAAYTRRLLADHLPTRLTAARHWLDYERALMGEPPLESEPDPGRLAKTRIQAHYLARNCFSDAQALLAGCRRLSHLPAAIVHGTRDPVCPLSTAQRLHRAWPQAEWVAVEGAGHGVMEPAMAAACIAALGRIADQAQEIR